MTNTIYCKVIDVSFVIFCCSFVHVVHVYNVVQLIFTVSSATLQYSTNHHMLAENILPNTDGAIASK